MSFNQWAARYPQAAADLQQMLGAVPWPATELTDGKSEAWAQQQVRFKFAKHKVMGPDGVQLYGMAWRNNVGATPAKTEHTCPHCFSRFQSKQPPLRYGLANDSQKLNESVKSADVIGIIPRLIEPRHVGSIIGQFASVEAKRPGWHYTGRKQEEGQAKWASLVARLGGYATFSTGDIQL